MADNKKGAAKVKAKASAVVQNFKKEMQDKSKREATLLNALKSTNSRLRAAAIKMAAKTQDRKWINKNVALLATSDKSTKVTRSLVKFVNTEKANVKHVELSKKVAETKKAIEAKKAASEEKKEA